MPQTENGSGPSSTIALRRVSLATPIGFCAIGRPLKASNHFSPGTTLLRAPRGTKQILPQLSRGSARPLYIELTIGAAVFCGGETHEPLPSLLDRRRRNEDFQ